MLFDIQGRRKRFIQAIYAILAVLMGGGLILFGIGGDVSGGLLDGIGIGGGRGGTGGAGPDVGRRVERAEERLTTNPKDEQALAELARGRYVVATAGDNFDEQRGFTDSGIQELERAVDAWERYVKARGDRKPSVRVARVMVQAYQGLNDFEGAMRTQEVVAADSANVGTLSQLALFQYLAGQFKQGDRTAKRAEDEAPEAQGTSVTARLKQLRNQAREYRKQVREAEKQQQEQGGGRESLAPPFQLDQGTGIEGAGN